MTMRLGHINRNWQALLASAAMATALFIGIISAPEGARAANECGALGATGPQTKTCTGATGIIGNGVEYAPTAAQGPLTVNIGDGTLLGNGTVTAPTIAGFGQYGVVVGNPSGGFPGSGIPVTGAQTDVTVNVNQFSQVAGTAGGVFVWTDGSGNDATANNHGQVTTTGLGLGSLGIGINVVAGNPLASPTGSGNALATNDGTVGALNNAINVWSEAGTATVNNSGSLTSDHKDGISTADPLTGLVPTGTTALVTNSADITAGRNGIFVLSAGDATVNATATSVINAGSYVTGTGIFVAAGGDVGINADAASTTSSTSGPGIMGSTTGLNKSVTIDAGVVNAGAASVLGFSGGVSALAANGGDATINLHGNVTTTGTWGAQGTSIGGNATGTTDAGVVVDPAIGMQMNTIGSGQAHIINNGTYNTTVAGLVGTNTGDGSVLIDNNSTGVVNATTGVGILATKTGPTGTVDPGIEINNSGDVIASAGSAVSVLGFDPSLTVPVNAQINNDKLLQGAGDPILTPTIGVVVDGSLEVNNNATGVLDTNSHLPSAYIANSLAGGDNTINNTGYMNGAMLLASANGSNTINNSSGTGVWNLSGLSVFTALGDNVVNNNSGATINSLGLSTLTFINGGTSTVNNTGTINVTNLSGVPGLTTFLGLDNFNNAGGLLNMSNGISSYGIFSLPPPFPALNPYGNGIGDMTITTGNFNGGNNSKLGIDAFLRGPGADSSSDLLLVGGSVANKTRLLVNDTNAGPGAYNPTGILFAHADGPNPGSFYLPQPIDKGFFSYDVYKLPSAVDPQLPQGNDWVLASTPNERAFELPKLITGAQTIWYESSGAWLDRTADLRRQEGFGCEAVPVAPVTPQPLKVGPYYDDKAMAPAPCIPQRWGVWARGFGGDFNRNDTDSTTLFGVKQTLKGDYDQSLWGIEGGADFVLMRAISGYGALFAGVLGGYVNSQMDFNATKDQADFKGGTVGGYLTYLAGGWYNDLLLKADLLNVDYTTTFQSAKVSPDSNSFGIRYDTGYRFNLGQGFFVDPQGTIAWVNTDMDNFTLFNAPVKFSNGDSVRGSLGGRVGYSWLWGTNVVEPFFDGKVWHEFEGDNKVALTSAGYKLTFKDQLDQTWGELGGGVNVFTSANASIFVKADALVGGDLEGFNVKGGGRLSW